MHFLANEGTKVVNGLQQAKSDGLTISAATVRKRIFWSINLILSIEPYHIIYQFCHFGHFRLSNRRPISGIFKRGLARRRNGKVTNTTPVRAYTMANISR